MDEGFTFRLTPEQLARLLRVAVDRAEGPAPSQEAPAGAVRPPAGLDGEEVAIASMLQASLAAGVQELGGRSVGQVLLDEHAEPPQIDWIKQWAKSSATAPLAAAELTCAKTIYYAAIASALIFRGRKTTRHGDRRLAVSFEMLAGKPWMPAALSRLFRQATERL